VALLLIAVFAPTLGWRLHSTRPAPPGCATAWPWHWRRFWVRSLLMPPFGNHGLWLAMLVLMAARGLWLVACYLRIERRSGFVAAPAPGGPT
jgi:Na+-driven multidrug efflux pump